MSEPKFATLAVHAGQEPDPLTGAVNVPVYLSSTFELTGIGTDKGWDYSRAGNPTRDRVELALAKLEGGHSGHAYSSGMAAIYALVATLHAGDHVLCSHNVYGGTARLFNLIVRHYGIDIQYVDMSNLDAVAAAIRPNTKLVHVETPTNPLMVLTDIAGVCEIAHARGVEVSVDNTFMSPVLQSPLALGADIVMHSTTKFLNGHSDGLGGALIGSTPEHKERFWLVQKAAGGIMSPFEAFLVLRGIRTLPLRMRQHEENGRAVAEYLSTQSKIKRLSYPGIEDPSAARAGQEAAARLRFHAELRPRLARSRGTIPRRHQAVPQCRVSGRRRVAGLALGHDHARLPQRCERESMGITEGLVRLSIGIEDKDDLIADLEQALAAV